jgi:CRP/FNR family transcriptional regulator, anaerobic regulatory protein
MATLAARTLSPLPADHPCADCKVRNIAICGVLGDEDLATYRNGGGVQKLNAGQPLFHEGDRASQVFTVTEGGLKLYKLLPDGRRQVMGFVFPGDYLGMTLNDEHAFTAEALQGTRTCRFNRTRFDDFVEEHPELEHELYRFAAHELAAAQSQMVLLGRKSAAERVATFLLDLLDRKERVSGQAHAEVTLAMSRSDIADYLGMTKETVSRVLAVLKSKRLIRLAALDRIQILDRAALSEMAEGASSN